MANHLCSSLDRSWHRLLLAEKVLIAVRANSPASVPGRPERRRAGPVVYFGGLLNNRNDPRVTTPLRHQITLNSNWHNTFRSTHSSDKFRRRRLLRKQDDRSPSPGLLVTSILAQKVTGRKCGLMTRAKSARVGFSRTQIFHNEELRKSTERPVKAVISIPTFKALD